MKFKKQIFRNYINMFGLKTKRRIIVIESDDWGSIRMPDKKTYDLLLDKGIKVDNCPYSKYDTLEREDDFNALYDLLNEFDNKYDKHPIITTNYLSANPDFKRIKENQFLNYEFENIEVTYNRFNRSNIIKDLIKEGINNKYIKPQFHGREHLNVAMWMELLKTNKIIKYAFDYNLFALSFNNSNTINLPYLASFMKLNVEDDFNKILLSGLKEFNDFFDYTPNSFIAPVYIWDDKIDRLMSQNNISSVQGLYSKNNYSSYNDKNPVSIKRNTRSLNNYQQLQLVRNCFFEPSTSDKLDWVSECLKDIEVAFLWSRPAIICTHRLNFVGALAEKKRNENLKLLRELMMQVLKKWPDTIFVSSDEIKNYL